MLPTSAEPAACGQAQSGACQLPATRRLPRQPGLEAVSSRLLIATLAYPRLAPQIAWDHVNYLY